MTARSGVRRTFTHRLRRVTTAPKMEELVRTTAQRFGAVTSSARLLPSFLVVGGQRCGTTTLFRLLSDHPAIVPPLFSKGIGYFDLAYDRGWAWYRGHFPLERVARLQTRAVGYPVTFESSGYYMYHPLAADRIGRDLPGVRVVVLVRDPVERAYSAYHHELARGFETESFERAIELEETRLAGEVERMTHDPTYQSFSHRHHSYLARGRYAPQIGRLQRTVGVANVLIVDANRFFESPSERFGEVLDWLGVPHSQRTEAEQLNARPRPPMPDSLRDRLMAHFEDSDRALVPLLGAEPSWRA